MVYSKLWAASALEWIMGVEITSGEQGYPIHFVTYSSMAVERELIVFASRIPPRPLQAWRLEGVKAWRLEGVEAWKMSFCASCDFRCGLVCLLRHLRHLTSLPASVLGALRRFPGPPETAPGDFWGILGGLWKGIHCLQTWFFIDVRSEIHIFAGLDTSRNQPESFRNPFKPFEDISNIFQNRLTTKKMQQI